ncbi:MAG: hypothetical protein JW751_23435 [Polyangiaceae bacterium]|nr:hypothetical protein [Polyangiaceae bacterium]
MNPKPSITKRSGTLRRILRAGLAAVTCAGVTAGLATGCLDRKVSPAQPNTTNIFVTQIPVSAVDKIDLLFVIDNSISMADKQEFLRQAVPQMLTRLLNPDCEYSDGRLEPKPIGSTCPAGSAEEFQPVKNMHIGIVTSSLGGHGGIACSPAASGSWRPDQNDNGQLIGSVRANADGSPLPQFNGTGFLAWDVRREGVAGAETDLNSLVTNFTTMVAATGETGCGYEATLEGFYRFLIDPQPPVEVVQSGSASVAQGINTTVLAQRAQFLRPDSLVAIVILTDENDCSVRDDGPGYFVAGASATARLPRGTDVCALSPNDPCCRSCALSEAAPPDGCQPLGSDPGCTKPDYTNIEEHPNLRCYEQKRRFGIDFLYPTYKYVRALQDSQIYGRACQGDPDCVTDPTNPAAPVGRCEDAGSGIRLCRFTNPLMADNANYPELIARSTSDLVYLAGIVGVPWQDIATAETLGSATDLEYLPASAGAGEDSLMSRWSYILGDPATGEYPADPFMWESVTPRLPGTPHAISGLPFPEANPVTGDTIQDVSAPGAASPINGHEYQVNDGGDLQYACVFPLPPDMVRECPEGVTSGCDCKAADQNLATKPLCQGPGSTSAGTTQYAAKAYPGLRFLDVLKGFGMNSIVGSVCPKVTTNPSVGAYGYNPSVRAVIKRLKEKLRGACLPRRLSTNPDGSVACHVVEITNVRFDIDCNSAGREPLEPELQEAVRAEYKRNGYCDNTDTNPCTKYTFCKLIETTGQDQVDCMNLSDTEISTSTAVGYCYIDAMQDRDLPGEDGILGTTDDIPGDGHATCSVDNPDTTDCIGNPALVEGCPDEQRRILRIVSPPALEPKVPFTTSTLFVACQGADLT